jgi:hypothetical protein
MARRPPANREDLVAPEERYARLVAALLGKSEVTRSSESARSNNRFGSTGLRINNKIFVMLVRGKLVLKLPERRVDMLIASGDGQRFEPRRGQPMKAWLTLNPASERDGCLWPERP